MIIQLPTTINDTVDLLFVVQNAIMQHAGFVQDWRLLPFEDRRDAFWRVVKDECQWADAEGDVGGEGEGDSYSGELYGKKAVARGKILTLIAVDTNTDGNVVLMIFDNTKERRS